MTHQKFSSATGENDFERLYTPWRMNYVRGERRSDACVFCTMRDSPEDAANLVLSRGSHSYVVMNLFPYNTGHLLIVPNEHVSSPEALPVETLHELAELLPRSLAAVRTALGPDGFNVGYNLGADAGAGIAPHMHQHLVPRWRGDANFMPIIGATKVLPELLPITYAKLRAEFLRREVASFAIIAIDRTNGRILVDPATSAPLRLDASISGPIWKGAIELAAVNGASGRLTGMSSYAGDHAVILDVDAAESSARWQRLADIDHEIDIPNVENP